MMNSPNQDLMKVKRPPASVSIKLQLTSPQPTTQGLRLEIGRRKDKQSHRRETAASKPRAERLVWCGCLEKGVPAKMSSSSSDRDSKLRGSSQNIPRVASKRDVCGAFYESLSRMVRGKRSKIVF
ncbi:hypothetical protein AVEN_252306-1 [Araneus ventricosus]|uniref:Uncharacterized protein n=1 Tax=Araneus ventricosus TaxID=182803 RepID=A0A4Y2DNY5_ARAVE|nr:hypothetical protein AVEN_252306-1 [Araneus ventricosus]